MARIGVALKIDVTKIEKARLFEGAKGKYLDATAFIDLDELDQYGHSGMITQDVTKEEKEAGTKGPILGNSKVFWREEGGAPQANTNTQDQQKKTQPGGGGSDDVPFAPVHYLAS